MKKFDTDISTFAQVQEGMTMIDKTCLGCRRPIAPEYEQCYACNRYGTASYAQVRQAKALVQEKSAILYSVAHNCTACGEVLPEDSTELHTCKNDVPNVYPMPRFRQINQATRKSRKASRVITLTPEQVSIDSFDTRERTFAGF